MNTGTQQESTNDLVQSYLQVRQFLGYVALLLPFTLVFIGLASGDGIEPSISDTYFTSAGDVFVGALCAIGIFLWAYKGYEMLKDERVAGGSSPLQYPGSQKGDHSAACKTWRTAFAAARLDWPICRFRRW